MTGDTVICSRCIGKECIRSLPFVQTRNIGSRKPRLEVFMEGVVNYATIMLGSLVETLLDLVVGYPSEERLE
eukprot:scaffold44673_cov229-Amphora_coffeaeformis.AAC.1